MLGVVVCCALVGLGLGCTDGVDNIVAISDCEAANGDAHFTGLTVRTYDVNGNPSCGKNDAGAVSGLVHMPGKIKIATGEEAGIEVSILSQTPKIEGSKMALTFGKLHSFFFGSICKEGKGTILPDSICSLDFCKIIGEEFCAQLDKHGKFSIADLPESARQIISLPDLTGVLAILKPAVDGDWKVGAEIKLGDTMVACILDQDIPFSS